MDGYQCSVRYSGQGIAYGMEACDASFNQLLGKVKIVLVAKALDKFSENKYVINAFYGLRPAVCALIATAGVEVIKTSLLNPELYAKTKRLADMFNIKYLVLFALIFIINKKIKLHPIFIILLSAVCGIALSAF